MHVIRPAFRLVLLSALAMLACANGAFAADVKAIPIIPSAEPARVGMSAEALAKIPARMEKFVDEGLLSGSVTLVVRQGGIVQLSAVGYADIAAGRRMTDNTLFAIASMTKPITATAVLILQDEGKLSVDDPVAKFIPQFKEMKLTDGAIARPITIRDLMTHTAGLSRPPRGEPTRSLTENAELTASLPLQFAPGSKWQYGDGLSICGRVIEVASDMAYEEFLRQRIFAPLAMKDTTFHPTKAQLERLALIYKPTTDNKGLEPIDYRESFLGNVQDGARRTPNPSGGLFSTAQDLARFYQMILNGGELAGQRIVSPAAVKQMTTVQTGDIVAGFTPGSGWGLGWCIVREPKGVTASLSPGTYGHGGAFGTQGWIDAKRQMILVLLIQRQGLPSSDGSVIRQSFQELATSAVRE